MAILTLVVRIVRLATGVLAGVDELLFALDCAVTWIFAPRRRHQNARKIIGHIELRVVNRSDARLARALRQFVRSLEWASSICRGVAVPCLRSVPKFARRAF